MPKEEYDDFDEMPKMPLKFPKPELKMQLAPRESFGNKKSNRFISAEKPVFIKLDRYKESIGSLNEIKSRLRAAASYLQKIKEIRQREDEELAGWQRDLEDLKEKLEKIDKNLFSDFE